MHFMECLMKATIKVVDIVVDVLASSHAFVNAYHNISRYYIVLEEDP